MVARTARTEVPTFCALCVSRCGARAIVEDGMFVALEPDPSHPTGRALCLKGKAAPELVYHPERLTHPLKRTRPKTDSDPGWQRIGWDEALDTVAAELTRISREHGPESVVFSSASPSTSAMSDSLDWVQRLRRAFGSPNLCVSIELCGWGRFLAPLYTYGASVPGVYMPDLENAGCMLFWGYNPSVARLVHATAAAEAIQRGARLIVVDPRCAGLAHKADRWLRVRPGADGALALSIIDTMIERGWFDRDFVRRWTNAPLLVRADNGRLLRENELREAGDPRKYVAWDEAREQPSSYDPAAGNFSVDASSLALFGEHMVPTKDGPVLARPVFQLTADLCARYRSSAAAELTGVPPDAVESAARVLWEHRPVAFYAWSGVEQHSNATQTARAIGILYALTGSFDAPGGNVAFPGIKKNLVDGRELLPEARRAKALGLEQRPLGPSQWEFVTCDDLYTAALHGTPYRIRGLVGFGANLIVSNADSRRGREALAALDFYVHCDLFMNPTAQMADIVLPAASAFETEALAVGFEVSTKAQSRLQLRKPVVDPRGEARSDARIVFDLASRLGLGNHFWGGDIDAGLRYMLEPSGVSLERLRATPGGVDVPLEPTHRKFAVETNGIARGFETPSRKIELYSETLLERGYSPLPEFSEPLMSPRSQPELAARYPLILTCAKPLPFCESQHRGLASLRRHAPDPEIELHPELAAARGIAAGDWVRIETPEGSVRARAKLNATLDPGVVCGQHGWWQACEAIGAPAYDPFGPDGANLNLIISQRLSDPIGGSVPHRAYLCNVTPAAQSRG
jgi:anaerobic selenocysteine-containing dehydrogenase